MVLVFKFEFRIESSLAHRHFIRAPIGVPTVHLASTLALHLGARRCHNCTPSAHHLQTLLHSMKLSDRSAVFPSKMFAKHVAWLIGILRYVWHARLSGLNHSQFGYVEHRSNNTVRHKECPHVGLHADALACFATTVARRLVGGNPTSLSERCPWLPMVGQLWDME